LNPTGFVRATTCRLSFGVRSGTIDLADADVAWELLAVVEDPVMSTSFESIYANALALCARYSDALVVAKALLAAADRHKLEFARPYGLVPAAMAYAGLRDWRAAHSYLDEADDNARKNHNHFAELYIYAARVRTLCQQGFHPKALALRSPNTANTIPAMRAEVLASRALALVAADRLDDAHLALSELTDARGVEAIVLSAAMQLAIAIKVGKRVSNADVAEFEELAFERGGLDLLVASYRAVPELLLVLLRCGPSERLLDLSRSVGDEDLLGRCGAPSLEEGAKHQLTRREREVYELLSQSLTNRQIAELLVISESTAKLHAHRVLKKLGLRSRKALAIQAALERSGQATSATDGLSADS